MNSVRQHYFTGFTPDPLGADEGGKASFRVDDPGGPTLPFDYLDPRAFEMLAYRLLSVEEPDHLVQLMQGTGERGRDCLVYSEGELKKIVQCKNYRDRLGPSQIRQELLKLAFHHILEPALVPEGTVYEVWAGGGFSETALEFLARWPASWEEPALLEDADRVLTRYARFSRLDWEGVRDRVLVEFPKAVVVRSVEPVGLSSRVRSQPQVYSQFFGGSVVAPLTDVESVVEQAMARHFTSLNDEDVKRMIDRIMSFEPGERLVFFSTVVLGLPPALVAQFKRDEFESFAKDMIGVTHKIVGTVMTAAQRLALQRTADFRRSALPCHPALPQLMNQLLTFSMLAQIQHLSLATLVQDVWKTYHKMSLKEKIEEHIDWGYDDYIKCQTKYDPTKHPPGSDGELRKRIADVALDGATSRDEYRTALRESVVKHQDLISSTLKDWMSHIPTQLLVISDSKSAFEDKKLLTRMIEDTQRLSSLRGSEIIPE